MSRRWLYVLGITAYIVLLILLVKGAGCTVEVPC